MGRFSEQNFYEILEVSPEATSEEVQRAFYRAKATYSPSSAALYSVFSESEAQELLKLIDEAYSILSNSARRREYDKKLFGRIGSQSDDSKTSRSTAEELPDFMLSQNDMNTSKLNQTHEKAHAESKSAPQDKASVGKTIISHYNVDNEVEQEIKNQNIFDGTFLQRVRLYKNISLDQLSETSRISRPYLISVETNDFRNLPAPVYVRGFVVSVARLLGLDEKKTADSYMKLFKEARGN